MFNSVVLDVVIGLLFVFLLYSLFATIIQEMLSSWYGLRAKMLRKSMELMLNGKTTYKTERGAGHWLRYLFLLEKEGYEYSFAAQFYNSSLIKSLGKADKDSVFGIKNTKPAYISASNFSEVLVYLLKQRGFGETDMEKVGIALKFNTYHIKAIPLKRLNHIYSESAGDMQVFRLKLEQWFNDTMDRSTGWYKRLLKLWLFIIGFCMACMFNANTITIIKKLSDDPTARTEMVKMAIESVDSTSARGKILVLNPDSVKKDYKNLKTSVEESNQILGLGWKHNTSGFWECLAGFLIMALAVSLGSSFWFDLLKKLVSIRGVGVKPEEKTDPKPEDPKNPKQNPNPVAQPTNTPVIYGSLLEEALAKHKDEILKIPGVQSVMKGKNNGQECIQINVLDVATQKEIQNAYSEIKAGLTSVISKIVITGAAKNHGEWTKGAIANKSGNNSYGSMGAVLYHAPSKNKYVISCWHVLKGDTNYDKGDDQVLIIDENKADFAERKSGGIGGTVDVGIAKCLDGSVMNNDFLMQILQLKTINYRIISESDELNKTQVKYYDWMNQKVQTGFIHLCSTDVKINYPDKPRILKDLLVLTKNLSDEKSISTGGNSGSMVFDANGQAIGIIVGGDYFYTYAVKLQHIFKLYKDYQFI